MTLESRAAAAAKSLRSSLAGIGPGVGFPTVLRRRRLATIGGLALLTPLVLGLGLVSGLMPAIGAMRLNVATALRRN